MAEKPRRRWWRKKRWWAVGAIWLLLPTLYPLSAGPAAYCVGRGWLTPRSDRWYFPIVDFLERWPAANEAFARYVLTCYARGIEDAASEL